MANFFYSLIRFFVAVFFILLGIIGMVIPWSETIRTALIQFVFENAVLISVFGFGCLLIGVILVTNIILNSRRRYYYVRSDHYAVSVNKLAVEQYVNTYWEQLFPNREIPSRITLKRNRIHITADLPYLPIEEQPQLVERIKDELDTHFKRWLGPKSQFNLRISFQKKPKEVS